jgi:hypothetical protein
VRVSTAEAESLFSNPEWGEPDHPNTQRGLDQQQIAAPAEPNSEEVTAEPTESQETEQPNEPESTPSETENELNLHQVEVNSEVYTVDQIKEFIDDSKNKDEWQRKNTQRSQDLADQRKAIRAESEKWKTLKEDEDLMETIKDYVDSDHPLFKEDLTSDEPEEAVQADSTETQRLNELEQKVQTFEAEKQVESDVATLVNAHPELRDNTQAMDQVLKAAIDNNLMDLDVAYAVAMHESANDSALKKAIENVEKAKELRKIPEIEGANRADRTVSSKIPANYDEVRDMALNEYNLYE